ncbi:MAG: AmmeMemoRadiSam system protein B [Epsilonproteobacteria bacterium]|nr:AmmeMemoRadiSam system protein B [Campylobacterota bacterium]
MTREAGVKGQFYPKKCGEIQNYIQKWNHILDTKLKDPVLLKEYPRAVIVPHAGYIYSGFTANIAYRLLANSRAKRVIVIGPSHRVYIDGLSGSTQDLFDSPCGDLVIDTAYLAQLKKHFSIGFEAKAHNMEHSTEVQMPLIKHYLPQAKVIEFIYGKIDYKKLAKLIYTLLRDPDNVVVISTDLSHFYTLENAKKLDNICLNGILKKDISILDRGCEACGLLGVKAMLHVAKEAQMSVELLDYRTSADASGDENRVVGYVSAYLK